MHEPTPNQQYSPAKQPTGTGSFVVWLVSCLLATVAVSFAAAYAPSRIRLIGLFPIAFGGLIGWLSLLLARRFEFDPHRKAAPVVPLAIGGWVLVTLLSFQRDRAVVIHSPQDAIAARFIKEFEEQNKPTRGESTPTPTSLETQFRQYLARRLQQIGNWPSPWPECFLIAESLAAATVAGVIISRFASTRTRDPAVTGSE
jgi:hypothetical protein